jgi:citrate lyase subunit beta / citryl-CoA lyase
VTSTDAELLAEVKTLLFVPGNRPERFPKAMDSGADAVIIDLEDAVAPREHSAALANVVSALSGNELRTLVRVHPTSDPLHSIELDALLGSALPGLRGLVVAKAVDPVALGAAAERLGRDRAMIPLVESAAGVFHAAEIAGVKGTTRLAFGAIDYTLDIGARPDVAVLDFARSTLVVASRVALIAPPIDSPPLSITDLAAVGAGALHARSLGFAGGLAIHPAQLSALRAGFASTAGEVAWAHAILAAEGDAGASQTNGQLVDRPVFAQARAILRNLNEEEG